MTYDIKKAELGREPLQAIKITVGYCSLISGTAPCAATETGDDKCYNTRFTCNDPANFTDGGKTYTFCQARSNLPIGENMIPSIVGGVSRAVTSITGGKGLGNRSTVKVTLNDHTWHDLDCDKYVSDRTYDPEDRGTYAGKWIARNPYFEGRSLEVLTGYIGSPFSWSDFKSEFYDISDVAGPTNGKWIVSGKDILSRTYGDKAKYPVASVGELLADIAIGATAATLSPAGIGATDYPASGYISIGKEAISYTRSGDVLTLTRAQWGTEAKAHSAGDTVQIAPSWDGVNVLDVLEELLVTGAGIPAAYIPNGVGENWTEERDLWLAGSTVKTILMKPEAIDKMIKELCQCYMFDAWADLEAQEIKIKALSPEPSGVTISTLTDNVNLVSGSVGIKKDSSQRISEVQVWYGKGDYSEKNEPEQFGAVYAATDPNSAGADRYGRDQIKSILCRWFDDKGQAAKLAGRTIARFVETPSIITFTVDAKDDTAFSLAQRVKIDSGSIQDTRGSNLVTAFQVTKITQSDPGSAVKVEALSSSFSGNYFFFAPAGTPDYASATEEQQAKYGYFSDATGLYPDGAAADKII